jgi:hypothetical protein
LGIALGVGLIAPLFWTLRLINARNVDVALYVVMGSVFGGLLVGLGVSTGYWFVTREGFMFFGPAMVAGFVLALGVLAVRSGVKLLSNDDTEG